jgi:YfiH family protein
MINRWHANWGLEEVGVHMRVSTRKGGVSRGAYASLNLGLHVGDEPAHVIENRAIWAQELGAKPVFMNQVHGQQCVELTPSTDHGLQADVSYTSNKGLACTMMVADCMPVLLADSSGAFVAALHVGWRGFLGVTPKGEWMHQGILAHALDTLSKFKNNRESWPGGPIWAWLGPCIGVKWFEVGDLVRDFYLTRYAQDHGVFTAHESRAQKWHFNLVQAVTLELKRLGLETIVGNDGTPEWCTATQSDHFFSHRRDGVSGRFCASIWLES